LIAALQELPDRQRHAYLLREVHGLHVKEIAERLALTSEQVEQALFAARNRLAEHLVFGDRLSCEAVSALDWAALARNERRALRGHLRACGSCRATVSTGRFGAFSPLGFLAGLRQSAAGLLSGSGAPAATAAKVGAIAATAAISVGIPVATGKMPLFRQHRARRSVVEAPNIVGPRPAGPRELASALLKLSFPSGSLLSRSDAPVRTTSPAPNLPAPTTAISSPPAAQSPADTNPSTNSPPADAAPPPDPATAPDPGATDPNATASTYADPSATATTYTDPSATATTYTDPSATATTATTP
jgi:hypothetical protein